MSEARGSKLSTLVRWLLGALLVWASLSKIANLQDFYISIAAYRLPLPGALLRLTAMILPWLELICGLLLLAGVWVRAALIWAILLFAIFVVCTGQAWARGLDISCGCFNLGAFGFDPASGKSVVKFVESVAFAFFRALLLFTGGVYVFRTTGQVDASNEPTRR